MFKNVKNTFYCFLFFGWLFCSFVPSNFKTIPNKTHFSFTDEPIDVVIPCRKKDLLTLDLCIEGIKKNGCNIRRVIVISETPLTDKAEWFNENAFPFDRPAIAYWLLKGNEERLGDFNTPDSRDGWYYQQLLKLYAPFVIPGISSNVLLLDADTIFLNPVKFQDHQGGGLYNVGFEFFPAYFEHAERLLPGFQRVFPKHSGITHHMLVQKAVIESLFCEVENHHKLDFWQAFCFEVDIDKIFFSGASEYEIYFNYVFSKTNQVKVRHLKWKNITSLHNLENFRKKGFHFVSCHSWSRPPSE